MIVGVTLSSVVVEVECWSVGEMTMIVVVVAAFVGELTRLPFVELAMALAAATAALTLVSEK